MLGLYDRKHLFHKSGLTCLKGMNFPLMDKSNSNIRVVDGTFFFYSNSTFLWNTQSLVLY